MQYLKVEDPADLWAQLYLRYHHQQTLYQPQTRTDWIQLRVMDFPSIAAHWIISQLRHCGQEISDADLIEKTLSTFPPAHVMLSHIYRTMKFKKHANLMAYLLMAEKNQQLLLRNAEPRPVREVHTTTTQPVVVAPVPEMVVEAHVAQASRRPPRGSHRKPYPSHHARESRDYGKRDVHKGYNKRDENTRREPPRYRENQYKPRQSQPRQPQGTCHKCRRKEHFAKECRASPYVVNMYRENQQLRNQTRQSYNFENPNPNMDISPYTDDVENYMTLFETHSSNPNEALLDSGSTHTIFTNPKFFNFKNNEEDWHHCTIVTMTGK